MRRLLFIACVALAVVTAASAEAGVAYRGTRGLIRTRSADTIGKGMLNFTLTGQWYSYNDSVLVYGRFPFSDPLNTNDATADYHMFLTRGALTYGLNEYFEIAAELEVRNWIRSPGQKNGHDLDVVTRGGLGDTYLTAKLGLPIPMPQVKLGALGEVSFPTGSKDRGFTTDETDFMILGLATLDFTDHEKFVPTRVHFNVGYQWNRNETYGYGIFDPSVPDSSGFGPPGYPPSPSNDKAYNDQFVLNTAIEFPAPQVTFFVEFDWQNYLNVSPKPTALSTNLLTLTPGVMLPMGESGFELKAAADLNLNSGDTPSLAGPADWGLWVTIGKTGAIIPQDGDGDGIADKDDGCPEQPEDIDGYQDADGCPDLDNDGDSINDMEDRCPDLAEDLDGFEDQDGCPDLDNDQDGIPDVEDRCPNEPEDFDGEEDNDGCPDLVKDSDNDGVPDDLDRCPLQAEDIDNFADDDGCPDLDNDLDGIPDASDQCPNAPETFNGVDDEDGCPDEKVIEQRFVLKGVTFESGSAALTPDSYPVLDEAVRSLMAYPEVRIEIRGYTDSSGKASSNMALSQRRADAVKQYMVNAGVDPQRMIAKGYGEENPIATNSTPAGRAENRRIEFVRIN